MDPNFILRLDQKRMADLYPESQLRRDPNFKHQHYLFSFSPLGANQFGLYFSQIVAASQNPNDQSVRTVDFLKRKRTSTEEPDDVASCIDERAAKFYLAFHQNGIESESPATLKVFDLDFDPVDHLGCRPIRIRGAERSHTVRTSRTAESYLGDMSLCPVTGNLFGLYAVIAAGGERFCSVVAEIKKANVNDSVLRAKFSNHKFEVDNASRSLGASNRMFSKLNHLMVFLRFDEVEPNKFVFICSYDTRLKLVQCLAFDPVEFVGQFIPAAKMLLASDSAEIGECLDIVGHMHKYVLFELECFILAVKWPKKWYTRKRLPPVQLSRVIDLKQFTGPNRVYVDPATSVVAITNTHIYVMFRLRDTPREIKRLALSQKFKDYRHCANCGKVEAGKRRNKEGKRIAQFKVCRLCKIRNLHLFYLDPEMACHYCSIECVKQHWNLHKDAHKRMKLERKTARAKTVVERF